MIPVQPSSSDPTYNKREDSIIAASGKSWTIQIEPASGSTATATKAFEISVKPSDNTITSVNVQLTLSGRISALA